MATITKFSLLHLGHLFNFSTISEKVLSINLLCLEMREIQDKDIKRLATIYDPDSKDTFVSVYINLNTNFRNFLNKRINACRNLLKKDSYLLDNFNRTIEIIEESIENNRKQESLIIFASHVGDFFEIYYSSKDVENLLVVDTSPYIRPAIEILENYRKIGLILMNTNRVKMFVLYQEKLIPRKKLSEDILNRHKKGGWSQARFQRIRKEEIKSFMKEVIESCNSIFHDVDSIVLAGPGNGKKIFLDMAPSNLKEKIVDVVDLDFDEDEKELIRILNKIEEREEEAEEGILIEKIKKEILRDGLAVYGVKEVLNEAMKGKVDIIVVEKGLRIKGWICERCQAVGIGSKKLCPNCKEEVSEVDVIEEILEFCERFNTRVVFVEKNEVEDLGGIAGLLRYK